MIYKFGDYRLLIQDDYTLFQPRPLIGYLYYSVLSNVDHIAKSGGMYKDSDIIEWATKEIQKHKKAMEEANAAAKL